MNCENTTALYGYYITYFRGAKMFAVCALFPSGRTEILQIETSVDAALDVTKGLYSDYKKTHKNRNMHRITIEYTSGDYKNKQADPHNAKAWVRPPHPYWGVQHSDI